MGALPKRKISKTRRDRRRAHYLKLRQRGTVRCPNCNSLKLHHAVCPDCGHFRGVKVVETEKKKKES